MYKREDLIQISYREFGKTMDEITQKVLEYQKTHHLTFNMVVPLLRSGAFPAFHLAAHLEVKEILPVYYMYKHGIIVKRLEIPKSTRPLPSELDILVCDACLTSGTTMNTTTADLRILYPQAKFYAVAVWLEEGINNLPNVEQIFYGKKTCEKKISQNPDTINGVVVAPWEDFEIDWNEIKDY